MTRSMALILPVVLAILPACDSVEEGEDRTEITLLAAYTPAAAVAAAAAHDGADDGVAEGSVEALIKNSIDDTNEAYENSRIPIRLVLTRSVEVDYELTERIEDLRRLVRRDDGHLDEIHTLRHDSEADIVILVVEERGATINAAVMADTATAFAVVHYGTLGAPNFALAHELGHLQGARHTPDSDPNPDPFPFGHAFRNDTIKTIMSTGGQRLLPFFSGPEQVYEGVILGDSTLHNAAEVLRLTAAYISNFRGPRTPTEFVPARTWPTTSY